MTQRTSEITVGLFMVAGFIALLMLALQVSGLSLKSASDTYKVYADFNDAGSLSPRGKVAMAGVTVGRIRDISLNQKTFQARVAMEIESKYGGIPADSSAVIRTSGLLGDQYIDISVGADEASLADGDSFFETQSAMNLERLITNFASGR